MSAIKMRSRLCALVVAVVATAVPMSAPFVINVLSWISWREAGRAGWVLGRHSMTSSARARSQGGTASPNSFAAEVDRLIFGRPHAPCNHSQFIAAKVSTTGRLLTSMIPMPG